MKIFVLIGLYHDICGIPRILEHFSDPKSVKDQRTRKVSEQAATADDDEQNSELSAVRAARFGLLNIVMSIKKGLSLIHNPPVLPSVKTADCGATKEGQKEDVWWPS